MCSWSLKKVCRFKNISRVLLRRQLMKRQLSRQMFVRKLLFLVCCFFSVIWNVFKLNVLKPKSKLNCQNEFFGKLFLKSGNTSALQCLCFHYWDFLKKIWRNNWQSISDVVKRFGYYHQVRLLKDKCQT